MSLTAEENERLTHVGPGTLMGNLLRRYWTPACLSTELPEAETSLRVRLLGEDLVAFRDTAGKVGLIEEHCPHRGASLYYGRNEEHGLRCVYHGWKFDSSGQCVDMPSERRSFADQIRAIAYPTHESGGIVWTYMGPVESMTPFRDFGTESLPASEQRASKTLTTCNWVQSLDGDLDSAHASFLHQLNSSDDIPWDDSDRPGYSTDGVSVKIKRADGAPRIEVQDDWYGFRYGAIRQTPAGYEHVRISTFTLPYITQIANMPFSTRQLMTVPVDDHNTWRYSLKTQIPAKNENPHLLVFNGRLASAIEGAGKLAETPASQTGTRFRTGVIERKYTMENEYGIDRAVQKSLTYSGIPDGGSQDRMVTETMGPIYDRTREHLGTTDLAIIRMHSILLEAAETVAAGGAAPATATEHDYRSIRSAEKILERGEDWRILGTDDDPAVQHAEFDRA